MIKKIIITGGLGYIGSHTVVELIQNKFDVIIVDNLSNTELFILDNIKNITGIKPIFYNVDLVDFDKFQVLVLQPSLVPLLLVLVEILVLIIVLVSLLC